MKRKKLNNIDRSKIHEAYQIKCEEYEKYTPEQLKEIFEQSKTDKKKRIGGIYRIAFMDVLERKLKERNLEEAIKQSEENNLKNNEHVEQTTKEESQI